MRSFKYGVFVICMLSGMSAAVAQYAVGLECLFAQSKSMIKGKSRAMENTDMGIGYRLSAYKRMGNFALELSLHQINIDYTRPMSSYDDGYSSGYTTTNTIVFNPTPQIAFGGVLNARLFLAHDLLYVKAGLVLNSATAQQLVYEGTTTTYYSYNTPTTTTYAHYSITSTRDVGMGFYMGSGIQFKVAEQFRVSGGIDIMICGVDPKVTYTDYAKATGAETQTVHQTDYYYTLNLGLAYVFSRHQSSGEKKK